MELTIVTIGTFVALLNEVTKTVAYSFKKDVSNFIPVCSLVYGIILGIVGFFLPNADMGSNIIEAIFIGISAGGTTTCCHQMYKQVKKKKSSTTTDDTVVEQTVPSKAIWETDEVSTEEDTPTETDEI